MIIIISGRFRGPEGSGPIWGVFGGSETGRLEGRPERPPSSTTRSKSTHSSRLCSVSLSSVLFRSVLLRDVVVGKIFFLRPEVGSDFCLRPEVGLENYISTSGRSRWTGHVVGHRGRRALTVDARSLASERRRIQKPARHRSRSENENFAQTDETSEPGIPKPTSGHLRRRRRARCPDFGLGIPKPPSGHQKKK